MTEETREERGTRLAARRVAYESADRTIKLAITYLKKSYWGLRMFQDEQPMPGYWSLLDQCILSANDIVEALPDEFFERRPIEDALGLMATMGYSTAGGHNMSDDSLEAAQKLLDAIQERRKVASRAERIRKLEATAGRTPQEAAAYAAKAQELRERG